MDVIDPIGHHELFIFIVQLLLLLVVARVLGEFFSSIGQPAVVGELLAGVVLGPSIFGVVAPGLFQSLFAVSEAQFHLLEIVAWIGLIMLLVVTGLETDIDLIIAKGRTAVILSLGGILVPFATGFALGWFLPLEFIAAPDQRLVFSLFIATAMSISAIPVIAKVLIELDVIQRDIGQLILAAGMVDDTLGWILLATVAGLARSGVVDLGSTVETLLSVVLFLALAFTVGQRLIRETLRRVDNAIGGDTSMITALMVLVLTAGAITQYLGLEAILGAFVVGILVGQVKRFDHTLRHTFEVMTLGIFAPIFFAIAGLRMDVASLLTPTVFAVGFVVLAVACFGKFAGIIGASRIAGLSRWEGITIGGGMNARGAMEIIVATIGLGLGILTTEMYSIIVMVAIVTSIMAPSVMRWSIPKIEMTEEERKRLDRQERQRTSFVGNISRILLPTRCSVDAQFAAQLVRYLIYDRDVEVTTMYVSRDGETSSRTGVTAALERYGRRVASVFDPRRRREPGAELQQPDATTNANGGLEPADESAVEGPERCLELMRFHLNPPSSENVREITRPDRGNVTQTVLDEAGNGYDLLAIGSSDRNTPPSEPLFTTEIDDIIQGSPCPLLVVNSKLDQASDVRSVIDETEVNRILLPTVGTEYTRHAAEVAFTIALNGRAIVEVMHVVSPPQAADVFVEEPDMSTAIRMAEEIVDREADLGRDMGVEVTTNVVVAEREPEDEILVTAAEHDADLIIMGSNLRSFSQRAFFGHRVEHVIRNADRPVAVVSSV